MVSLLLSSSGEYMGTSLLSSMMVNLAQSLFFLVGTTDYWSLICWQLGINLYCGNNLDSLNISMVATLGNLIYLVW